VARQMLVFVIGAAGAGKSTFTSSFRDWLRSQEVPSFTVNLDPAVEELEYDPDVDVREYVFTRNIMERYSLGPNGAIIASMDILLEYVSEIDERVKKLGEGYILVDTPGQMEIFTFRRSGKYLVESLCTEERICAIVFVCDSVIIEKASDLVAQLLSAASVFYRFTLPMVAILNKVDVVPPPEREKITRWTDDPQELERELLEEHFFGREVYLSISGLIESIPIIPTSARTGHGLDKVYIRLQGIFRGGEDYERTTSLTEDLF